MEWFGKAAVEDAKSSREKALQAGETGLTLVMLSFAFSFLSFCHLVFLFCDSHLRGRKSNISSGS